MAANVYKGICEFLNAENLEVNQDDLRDPSPELVHFLYATLARIVFDLDEKAYTKDVAAVAAQLEAHHHERSFSLIKTVNLVGRFCKDAEVFGQSEQFSYADVISPKRDRTRLVLQSLIGYIEFKRQHTLDVRQVYDEADEKERVLHDDKFKRDAVKDHATRLRQDLDSARRKKAEHMQRCVELRQKVLELQTVVQNHEEACKQKRDEYTSLEETMKQTRMELTKASDKNRELETNIVHSPDELNAEIHRMEQELQQAVGECEQYAKTAEEFDKDLKRLEDVEHAMENLSSDLQQLEAEWEALAPLRKEKDDTSKKISDAKITLQLLEEQRQTILDEQETRRTELKLSQNAQLHEQKTYEQQLATNKTALKELTEHEREARSEAARLRRAVDDKTKAYDQLEVDFDAAIEELTQRFLEVKQYMEDRTAEIEAVREIARPVLDRL